MKCPHSPSFLLYRQEELGPPAAVAAGPYLPDWEPISRLYVVPPWWREAKFGAWSHWGPQSMPEQGDWYARGMYLENSRQYNYHLRRFGHPSEYGYKDICRKYGELLMEWTF